MQRTDIAAQSTAAAVPNFGGRLRIRARRSTAGPFRFLRSRAGPRPLRWRKTCVSPFYHLVGPKQNWDEAIQKPTLITNVNEEDSIGMALTSGELGALPVDQLTKSALLVSHDPGRDIGREAVERAGRLVEGGRLDMSECGHVLVQKRL